MPEKAQNNPRKPKKAKKYITERIIVDKLIPGGQALATLENGKKIFLWNALPGEIILEAEVTKEKSHFIEAIATKIERTSSYRIAPRDDCYLSTSPWQIMDYDYELTAKRELLEEIFRQHQISAEIPAVATDGRDFFYRNKMEYSLYFDHDDQKIHPAFHGRGSHTKIKVEKSSLERLEIWEKATAIIDELNAKGADARKFQSLLLRTNQAGEVAGGLFENYQPRPKFPNLKDQILGKTYSYSPNGFFQINLPVYEMALQDIKKHIHTEKVLDLYAGVGTIGLSVAENDLTLVECDKSAYTEMEKNCENTSAKPVLAKSEEALDYIEPDQTVILDPPRAGCHEALLDKLLEVEPPVIIYLSCNPATQARDAKILEQKYQITSVQPFNFFPRTPHLENLIIMEKR